jgi:ribosome-binding factor A
MGKHRTARDGDQRSAGVRSLRLEELFREELNSIIDFEINDPRLEDTRVSFVELSRDGSRARVWFSVAPHPTLSRISAAELEAAFERASGFLRRRLCEALPLKRMPELCFRHDPSLSTELGEPLA